MDLNTVTSYRFARSRADLALAPGERVLGGGTWLFSEPQPAVTGLVDLSTMGWPDLELTDAGLRIGATCTIATLVAFAEGRGPVAVPEDWAAASAFPVAANALLASFKIWNTATVGGNVCQSFCAASMVSLAVGPGRRGRHLDPRRRRAPAERGIADDRQRHQQPRRRRGAARDRAARARAALPPAHAQDRPRRTRTIGCRRDRTGGCRCLGRLHGHGRDPHAHRAAVR